MCVVVQW